MQRTWGPTGYEMAEKTSIPAVSRATHVAVLAKCVGGLVLAHAAPLLVAIAKSAVVVAHLTVLILARILILVPGPDPVPALTAVGAIIRHIGAVIVIADPEAEIEMRSIDISLVAPANVLIVVIVRGARIIGLETMTDGMEIGMDGHGCRIQIVIYPAEIQRMAKTIEKRVVKTETGSEKGIKIGRGKEVEIAIAIGGEIAQGARAVTVESVEAAVDVDSPYMKVSLQTLVKATCDVVDYGGNVRV